MTISVEAIYEDGVLKPERPLPLTEHEKVRITAEPQVGAPTETCVTSPVREPIWEQIVALTADIPPEELDKLPTDGASQHDHYLYGTPKRPE